MPTVNFVGEVECATSELAETLCLSWGILPGSRAWTLKSGECSGETHITDTGKDGFAILNHPIDAYYQTTSGEGWPFLVVEIWDKSEPMARNFVGCGCVWMPMEAGKHTLDINIWKPIPTGIVDSLSEIFLPTVPDLKALREVVVNPYLRSKYQTESTGEVKVNIQVTTTQFENHGVAI